MKRSHQTFSDGIQSNCYQAFEDGEDKAIVIDFAGALHGILDNWKRIAAVAILFAVVGGLYAQLFGSSYYSAVAKIEVLGEYESSIDVNAIQIGQALASDYHEVFYTWEVCDRVCRKLNLDYSYEDIQSKLTVTNPLNTRLLYITVRHSDAQMAADIANAYALEAKNYIREMFGNDVLKIFSTATVPNEAIQPSTLDYILMGFMGGMFFAAGVVMLWTIVADYMWDPIDITKMTGIPMLGVIPKIRRKSAW